MTIDLTVPTGWNQCTTAQLEMIAGIILRRSLLQDRYHPYDPDKMKAEAFFALAGLRVLDKKTGDDDTFLCEYVKNKKRKTFPMAVWQVQSFIGQHLKWLDSFDGLQVFPYPDFGGYWQWQRWHWQRRRLIGPAPLLDGMTWRQFRFAQSWLGAYATANSQLAELQQRRQDERTKAATAEMQEAARQAREGFLAAIFDVIDPVSFWPWGRKQTPRPLRRMRQDQFQVCLIWWQSMMAELQRKYRRCFTDGSKKKQKRAGGNELPIDLYTRSTATLQKYLAQTEDDINRQPCRVILQHLDDMAREAEEMEKLNRKSRSKH